MDQDALRSRIGQKMRIIPSDANASRVNACDVRFDGGAFTVHLYDTKESPMPRPSGPSEDWLMVELARFAFSPQALARLKESIAKAEAMYVAVIGRPLQSDAEMNERSRGFFAGVPEQSAAAPKKR